MTIAAIEGIAPTHLLDPLVTEPIVWLNEQIAHFTSSNEGDDCDITPRREVNT